MEPSINPTSCNKLDKTTLDKSITSAPDMNHRCARERVHKWVVEKR